MRFIPINDTRDAALVNARRPCRIALGVETRNRSTRFEVNLLHGLKTLVNGLTAECRAIGRR